MQELQLNTIYVGQALKWLKKLPSESVHCIVTSPPYWGLRDYGVKGQLGLERTPQAFIRKLVMIFRECKRVLREDGTLWLNIGDSYANNGGAYGSKKSTLNGRRQGEVEFGMAKRFEKKVPGLKQKDLVGIPWMLAFALRKDGWYLRQDIIWHKPNPMPESVNDRCTKSHEYIFLLSRSNKYYYDSDSIKEESVYPENRPAGVVRNRLYNYDSKENNNPEAYRKSTPRGGLNSKTNDQPGKEAFKAFKDFRNKRSVWTVTTGGFTEAHFATFPEELIVDCIKAGCPIDGIVLDPFFGAGTTGLVARKLNRNYIGIELNPEYAKLADKRLKKELGMFQ